MNDPRSDASSFLTKAVLEKGQHEGEGGKGSLLEEMDGSAWKEIHDNPVCS